MLRRSNKRKNSTDDKSRNPVAPQDGQEARSGGKPTESQRQDRQTDRQPEDLRQTMSREDLLAQSGEASKIFEDIQNLRQQLDQLKNRDLSGLPNTAAGGSGNAGQQGGSELPQPDQISAAEQAVIVQARKDAEDEWRRQELIRQKERALQREQQRVQEAQQRAAIVKAEADRKRQMAMEAARKAREAERNADFEQVMREGAASPERMATFFGTKPEGGAARFGEQAGRDSQDRGRSSEEEAFTEAELAAAKEALLSAHKEQEQILDAVSKVSEIKTEELAQEQQVILEQTKQEARAQRQKLQRQAKERRQQAERAEKEARAQRKREEKAHRAEQKERQRREREQQRREKRGLSEEERLEKASQAAAELGGGVVNVQGVSINTEVKEIPHFSWKDFFGLADRREKQARTKAEKHALQEERERRKEEARMTAELMSKQRMERYRNSAFGKRMNKIKDFCEHHKTGLLTGFAIVLTAVVGTAGVFNYCTAYEYSYNGKPLGIVKEKDQVLAITDLVQGALTEDKDLEVVIDAKEDISFKRVPAMGDVEVDSTEDVLKRLTYMGDLNVKAFGIYVDGKKVGAVESKETAADVIQDIKDRYTSGIEGAEIEEAVFIEKVEVKQSNTGLSDISSREEMVDILCTSGEKETLHKVVAGETLADVAKLYSMKEEDLLADNGGVDPKKLEVGSTLVIRQNAPVLTVKITELVTYEKVVEFETQEQDAADIYEGYTETQQKGENGLSEITARIVTVNGEAIQETNLVTTVKKEPVTQVVLVGTKERPPTVGSGKYKWPLAGGYTISSRFGYRWGRLHAGVDLACPPGNNVMAADGGTVTRAGYHSSYGYLIVIDHQNGMETYYAHNSKLLVSAGDKVFQGQHIAESGNTGRSTGAHLHFEIHVNGVAKNPLNYLP